MNRLSGTKLFTTVSFDFLLAPYKPLFGLYTSLQIHVGDENLFYMYMYTATVGKRKPVEKHQKRLHFEVTLLMGL